MHSVNVIDIITVFSYNSNKFRREEIGGVKIINSCADCPYEFCIYKIIMQSN